MDKERIFDWNLNGFADGRSRTGLDSIDHLRDQLTSARISFTSGQIKKELEFALTLNMLGPLGMIGKTISTIFGIILAIL